MNKPAITQVSIDETIANRWSGRAYDSNQAVSQAQIIALLEAARWAPSCFGDQPWRFIVWNKKIDTHAWQQALDCLVPSNQAWAKDAPLLMLVCADTLFNHNQQANRWAQYDTGAAAENLCLQASSMGLMAHQMGGFNADLARDKFKIPAQFTLMAMISVGYQALLASLDGDLLTRETATRTRRALNDLFFSGCWNEPIE
ncbi:MAG: nitroreductase family protein [Methylotenera sp.]|nr:nitroreductase family protein [Methylotenera sp.]